MKNIFKLPRENSSNKSFRNCFDIKKIIFRVTTRIHENFTLVIQTIYEIEAYKILKMYFFKGCAKKIADWCFKKIPLRISSAIFSAY